MTFSMIVVNHHLLSHPLPFYPLPSILSYPYQLRGRDWRRKKKKVGGYLYWVAPPLSPGHWEWVNTKPPLLTSALKHPVRHEQARSLCHCSNLRKKGQKGKKFQTGVNVQSDSWRQNLPAASSRPVRWYLRDTGTVLTSTLKYFSILLMVL